MTTNPLDRVTVLLHDRAGLRPEPSGRARLERLLQDGARLAGMPVVSYVDMVDTQPAAFADLLDRVTVQHSAFFRDPVQFDALRSLLGNVPNSPQTIWSAGCGNGQEPYSLAMLLDESGHSKWHVLATDISGRALKRTRAGWYTTSEVEALSADRRSKYLVPVAGGFEIAPFLRRRVRVLHHNLALEYPRAPAPICAAVFCRNVFMYFGRQEVEACIARLATRIAPDGYLFLGHSDSTGRIAGDFTPVHVAGALCYRRLAPGLPSPPTAGRRAQDQRPALHTTAGVPPDGMAIPDFIAQGESASAGGDLRAAVRAFRQAIYLDPNLPVAYFQLGAALERAGDRREARRAFAAAGLALMRTDMAEELPTLEGYTRRDLARAIAFKLTEDRN